MSHLLLTVAAVAAFAATVAVGCGNPAPGSVRGSSTVADIAVASDSLAAESSGSDSLSASGSSSQFRRDMPPGDEVTRYSGLTDEDFSIVAEELNVEIAAMKAVVAIEAGKEMKGFWAPGVPVINFDRSVFAKYRNKGKGKVTKVPSGLSGYGLREWTQLVNARKTSADGADMGTFWGMFQIGGFNYKICGCASVQEFVDRMSNSEFDQLELFAALVLNTGMVKDLRAKNWASFARKYNGASYASRGYHTKMAAAYKKFKTP